MKTTVRRSTHQSAAGSNCAESDAIIVASRLFSERFLYLRALVLKTQQFQIVGGGGGGGEGGKMRKNGGLNE